MSSSKGSALASRIAGAISLLPHATIAEYRRLRRTFSAELRHVSAAEVIDAAALLAQFPRRGHRFVAYELVQKHLPAAARLDAPSLERLGRGISDWDEVDCFSIYLSGPAWQRRQIADAVVLSWARSSDRWWRRAALVSTVPLNSKAHGGGGDGPRTLRVCRMLEDDRDPMVVKALSWALRELAKRNPKSLRDFLAKRSDNLAPQVRREVANKLETGLKNPGRRRRAP